MTNPIVSIIIPVFNTERYINSCINSALEQLNGDVELIIVDDGSTDRSLELCLDAQKKHSNILVFQQKNSGPGAARNLGISKAHGKYIYFLDSDDLIPSGAIGELHNIAESYSSEITCGLLYSFNSSKAWLLSTLKSFDNLTAFNVSLKSIPALQQHLSPCGKLFNKEYVRHSGIRFLDGCKWGEDAYFVLNLMRVASRISLVPKMVYKYRVRDSGAETSLTSLVSVSIFSDLEKVTRLLNKDFEDFDTEYSRRIRDLHYCRSMRYHLERFSKASESISELNEAYSYCQKFLLGVPDSSLDVFEPINSLIFELIKLGEFSIVSRLLKGERSAEYIHSILELSSVKNEIRAISLVMKSFMAAAKGKDKAGHGKIAGNAGSDNKRNKISNVIPWDWRVKVILAKLCSLIVVIFDRNVWLIGERAGGAVQDTGFKFFAWLKNNRLANPYFVTKKECMPYVSKHLIKNVLRYGSFKHYVYFFASSAYVYNDSHKDIFHHWQRLVENKDVPQGIPCVFLQHGVIATSKIHGYYDYEAMVRRNQAADIFVVSSERERSFVTRGLGHPSENVVVTGLSRFDDLPFGENARKLAKRKILFVPTWRNWLRWNTDHAFLASEFYREIFDWLLSRELHKFLDDNDLELELLLHHAFSKYAKYFDEVVDGNVTLSDMDNCNVQAKLIEAGMLVTDYSSVGFDFAYMGKPVIYFQFDRQDFIVARGGSFIDMENDLPGPVVSTPSALEAEIERIVNSDWMVDAKFAERSNLFFDYRDTNNSARIYDAICNRLANAR